MLMKGSKEKLIKGRAYHVYRLGDIIHLRYIFSPRLANKFNVIHTKFPGFPAWNNKASFAQMIKNLPAMGRPGFYPWVGKIPWKRAWQPTPVFLPGESPRTEEPGRLQSTKSQRVEHDWATKHSTAQTKFPAGLFVCMDKLNLKCIEREFSGGSTVKNPPANTKDRKIPHAMEQQSPCATTIEPVLQSLGSTTTEPTHSNYWSLHPLEPMLCSKRNHCRKKPTYCNQRKAHTAMKTQQSQNNLTKLNYLKSVLSAKKDAQCTARETVPQIALRDCSEEIEGTVNIYDFGEEGFQCYQVFILQKIFC